MFAFACESPGFPPVATMYTSVELPHVKCPDRLKFPRPSVVVDVPSTVDAVASPPVATAYNCTVAPETGCCPPWIAPRTLKALAVGSTSGCV